MALVLNGSNDTITGLQINSTNIVDGSIVNADINASAAIASTKLSGVTSGITMHDVWAVTASLDPAGGTNAITANWARSNSYFGTIGSAMTESSGVFTFPSTGIYYVQIAGCYFRTSADGHGYTGFNVMTTTDGASFANQQGQYGSLPALSGTTYSYAASSYTFDVTNTSTHKVLFQTVVEGSGTSILNSANSRRLSVEFTRIGDT
jgi:hypothetical protein|tara:strand:- start:34 stop:651 length:618 start_codon:yes stop_codon:yes gene_type:complete